MIKIETLGDLTEAVTFWINRDDKDTVRGIPYFIYLAEEDFSRLLKIPEYEELKSYVVGKDSDVSKTTNAINLPDDFDEVKALIINGKPCFIQSNEAFYEKGEANLPAFTIIGRQLLVKPHLKDDDSITLIYFKKLVHGDILSKDVTHIMKGPDVMLYLSLRHAALFLRDNEQAQYWEQKAQEAIVTLQSKIDAERWNGSTIVIPA